MDRKTAGLIGVGAMGRGILKRLLASGQHVRAFDTNDAGRKAALAEGAEVVDSGAEAAEGVDFIHIVVVNDEQVVETILSQKGILAGCGEQSLIFLHSTVLPSTARRMAEAVTGSGARFIEAPIVGIPTELEAGMGRFLVAGPEDVVALAREQLLLLGQTVDHFGEFGSASHVKIVRAILNGAEKALLNETLQLASAGGVDLRQFLEFEQTHFAKRCITEHHRMFDITDNHARMRPYTNLFQKDVFLAASLANEYGLNTPIIQGTARAAERLLEIWKESAELQRKR